MTGISFSIDNGDERLILRMDMPFDLIDFEAPMSPIDFQVTFIFIDIDETRRYTHSPVRPLSAMQLLHYHRYLSVLSPMICDQPLALSSIDVAAGSRSQCTACLHRHDWQPRGVVIRKAALGMPKSKCKKSSLNVSYEDVIDDVTCRWTAGLR